MTIEEIIGLVDGKVICCEGRLANSVEYAFASDLMSDVLTLEKENFVLITGLANLQAIRTAEMSDISCIIFARDKKIGEEMVTVARENNILLAECPYSVFKISGVLYQGGIKSVY
jgi:hypothetical protein